MQSATAIAVEKILIRGDFPCYMAKMKKNLALDRKRDDNLI